MAPDPHGLVADAFARLERAWNDADGHAFAVPFTADADFVDIRGSHHRGTAAIGAGHQAIFGSVYAGSTIRYEVAAAAGVAPGCVVGHVAATLDAPSGPLAGTSRAVITAVLVDVAGTWRIRAFHNTLVTA